jgi:uncharacterized protein
MSPFLIDLATLVPGMNRVELECEAAELGLPPAEWQGRVRGVLDVEKNGEQVSVRGRVEARAGLDCVRCLRALDLLLGPPLEVFAERAGTSRRVAEEQELERDDYMKFHDGRHLDLREEARELLLLELPIAPLCREDCRGLCPHCGADLNLGPCGCSAENGSAGR